MKQTPIISNPTATLQEMQEWAISKKATTTFVANAVHYYEICTEVGVNPSIAYVQYAEETGFGKFGGLVPESYCNPCGLKSTSQNSDKTSSFKKFASWKQGIWAHIDHLALYAGAPGYPKDLTVDPRHFPNLKGKAPTVEKLSGNWSSSKDYHSKLLTKKKQLEFEKVTTVSSDMYAEALSNLKG